MEIPLLLQLDDFYLLLAIFQVSPVSVQDITCINNDLWEGIDVF